MKRIFSILPIALLTTFIFAQSPEKMSYQAVIRNSSDQLVTTSAVGIQISIIQGTIDGNTVFQERHFPTTNTNGLLSIEIGMGTLISGNFSAIDWANGPYFIKTETDLNGGANYTITGTSQLLSVPYAFHANTADSAKAISGNLSINTNSNWASLNVGGQTLFEPGSSDWGTQIILTGAPLEGGHYWTLNSYAGYYDLKGKFAIACEDTNAIVIDDQTKNVGIGTLNPVSKLDVAGDINVNNNNIKNVANPVNSQDAATKAYVDANTTTYKVGDFAQGGVIFYVDETGQHGLACTILNQFTNSEVRWYAGTDGFTHAAGDGLYAGEANTAIIIAAQVAIGDDGATYGARICNELYVTQGSETYGDYYLPSKSELNLMYQNKAVIDAVAIANGGNITSGYYWSSTEAADNSVWAQWFASGLQYIASKSNTLKVRAVRRF